MTHHRLLLLWLLLLAPPSVARDAARLALDLRQLPENLANGLDVSQVEKEVTVRLIHDGFAVVSADQNPDAHLKFEEISGGLRVTARIEENQSIDTHLLSLERVRPNALEVAHKVSALARRTILPQDTPPQFEPTNVSTPEEIIEKSLGEDGDETESLFTLTLGAAAIVRSFATDLLWEARASFAIDEWRLLADVGRLGGVFTTAQISPEISEWQAQLGFGRRLTAGNWGEVSVGILTGAVFHDYRVGDAAGVRVDPLVSAHLHYAYIIASRLVVGLAIQPGWSMRGRTHIQDGDALWHRGPWQLSAGVFAGFRI